MFHVRMECVETRAQSDRNTEKQQKKIKVFQT